MSKANDLTGKKFGRLTVIKRVENFVYPNGYTEVQWLCKCDCGNNVVVRSKNLTKKNGTKSCGCLHKQYNKYDLSGEYGIGYTKKGEEFYFDLEDYDLIKNYCWHITNNGYVVSTDKDNYFKHIRLHRVIMGNPDESFYIDHIHGYTSRNDNRKSNLRVVTPSQNGMNAKIKKNNTSGVTGVSFHKKIGKWVARIGLNYNRIQLGSFDNLEDAIAARKQAEEKYFGEYSYDNSMKKGSVA